MDDLTKFTFRKPRQNWEALNYVKIADDAVLNIPGTVNKVKLYSHMSEHSVYPFNCFVTRYGLYKYMVLCRATHIISALIDGTND